MVQTCKRANVQTYSIWSYRTAQFYLSVIVRLLLCFACFLAGCCLPPVRPSWLLRPAAECCWVLGGLSDIAYSISLLASQLQPIYHLIICLSSYLLSFPLPWLQYHTSARPYLRASASPSFLVNSELFGFIRHDCCLPACHSLIIPVQ